MNNHENYKNVASARKYPGPIRCGEMQSTVSVVCRAGISPPPFVHARTNGGIGPEIFQSPTERLRGDVENVIRSL